MDKAILLQQLHEKHHAISTCALKHTATQPVFGDGNPEAKIVFIGEAPGKTEDESGKPFIGRAGKFLTEMLASIGMSREQVYITNIVKYRPPENRDPTDQEKKECALWLFEEIRTIKPLLIIFLGRHAMTHFLPELKISEAHGKLVHRNIPHLPTEYFLPLYHPAAALYNGSMRQTLIEDFSKVPKMLTLIQEKTTH
jgi:DNA polymerase